MTAYSTPSGVHVQRETTELDHADLTDVIARVETRRGGVLSSGMEYPGRYSRFHLAYSDPPVEVVARGREVTVRALNARGYLLVDAFADALTAAEAGRIERADAQVKVVVPEPVGRVPEEERSKQPTAFSALRVLLEALACDDAYLGFWGAFGYDLAYQFEPIPYAKDRPEDQRDLVLHLADEVYVVDRKRETARVYRYDFTLGDRTTKGLARETETVAYSPAATVPDGPVPGVYADTVRRAKQEFKAGNLFEVVPGHEMYAACDSPTAFYERLRVANPAPYEFIFNLGDSEYLVGASPEMFVRVHGDRVETCPIAGTIARGDDPVHDATQIAELIGSLKEESELTMCTDVDRNDKARVCVPGSVKVLGRRQIEMYSRLIHTVDHVEGRLREDMDALDAFLTHMWSVTVTGAPKTWAMRFIEEQETTPRRWYGGAVGYIGLDGSMNTGLTLRTAQIRDGVACVRAGATLLYDSVPEAEEAETHLKARALLETASGGIGAAEPKSEPIEVAGGPAGNGRKVLLVDHEDSFVNTLGDYFRQHGCEVTTLRFGFDTAATLDELAPDLVVLSPGPGRPGDFGTAALLDEIARRGLPAFGVCLGLQAMIEHAGGELSLLDEPSHGKPGSVKVTGGKLFDGLPDEVVAARYHSLYATADQVKGDFAPTAAIDEVVMSIEAPEKKWFAVQFHPESILTAAGAHGHRIIGNVLRLTA
ncbi:anthranilate synthase component I [Glycomyces buryatensis]|uniref:Anthranilate synthase n=1 Tax=Glycomyces buryatensis TaxID=2570927 RepID=A0A4S8Q4Q2_9ACTN|nr:anthranilate synthase component I [Glycomyces buryatensis]THV35619.1 anthranilate synthase component I [Glycomyces buryatensis]